MSEVILCAFLVLLLFQLKNKTSVTFGHSWQIQYFLNLKNHNCIFKLFSTLYFIHLQCLYWVSKLGALGFPWNFSLVGHLYTW